MKSLRITTQLAAIILVCLSSALAQGGNTKEYKKDGLSFSYPSNWMIDDKSNADAQEIHVGRADVDGQIRVWVYRTLIDTPEKMAEAKKVLVDSYVAKTSADLAAEGGRPQSLPAKAEIGGVPADGVKITASLGGEAGAAEIFWSLLGQRLAVLTVFRPDRAMNQMAPAWDAVRKSLAVEPPKPTPKATPKPSPQ